MYWADKSDDDNYPMERQNLQADFNPHTVDAAARAGVHLDPKDGLDMAERTWLHGNLSRYMQSCVDTAISAGASRPVYSHMLLSQKFPTAGTGHHRPYSETARVRGAGVGLETLRRTELDALWRVREWGRWGCVNREENDGFSMEYHLAMLQMQYMMGADLFNSYNWIKVNDAGRAVSYFNEFLASLAVDAGIVTAGERISNAKRGGLPPGETTWPLEVRSEFPWSNAVELSLSANEGTTLPLEVCLSQDTSGSLVASCRIFPSQLNGKAFTRVRFGDLTQCEQDRTTMTLHLKSPGGWFVGCGSEGPDYRLLCELRPERRRSQYIMETSR
jgi:hypothetical protein